MVSVGSPIVTVTVAGAEVLTPLLAVKVKLSVPRTPAAGV